MNKNIVLPILFCIALIGLMLFYTRRSIYMNGGKFPLLDHHIKHLGIIMDGNRRWARSRNLQPWLGHQKGTDPVKMSVEFCIEQKIPYLSLYAFSLENLQRSQNEIDALFDIIEKGLNEEEFQKLLSNGVKVKFIGDRSIFPERLNKTITDLETKTINGTKLLLNILFCYGGQQELTAGIQDMAQKIKRGKLAPNQITPEVIKQHLWSSESPAVDLLIRTGGKKRLSNFMPWDTAYSELAFTKTYWPAITKDELYSLVKKFSHQERNFGA